MRALGVFRYGLRPKQPRLAILGCKFSCLGIKIRPYMLIFHTHIAENDTDPFCFVKKINFIKQNWRKLSYEIVAPTMSSILRARILNLDFLQFYLIKLIFFHNTEWVSIFSSTCAWNMSSYGHILVPKHDISVPKIANLGCIGPKTYLKTPNARKFLDQKDCWVEIIKRKKRVENFRCGSAMVTKIVKNT